MSNVELLPRRRGPKKGTPSPRRGIRSGNTPVLVRIPQELIDHLDACAAANYRSRSAEIRYRLEASIQGESIDEHGVIVQRTPTASK